MWRVINKAKKVNPSNWEEEAVAINIPFSEAILSDEDLALWEAEKRTEGFGKPIGNNLLPPRLADLLENWVIGNNIGVQVRQEPTMTNPMVTYVRRFHIPAGGSVLVNDRQRKYLEEVFGIKKIFQKLEPGETTRRVHYEGFLEFEPVREKVVTPQPVAPEPVVESTQETAVEPVVAPVVEEAPVAVKVAVSKFHCGMCKKDFDNQSGLTRHRNMTHRKKKK
jgi:hypothetical protein